MASLGMDMTCGTLERIWSLKCLEGHDSWYELGGPWMATLDGREMSLGGFKTKKRQLGGELDWAFEQ